MKRIDDSVEALEEQFPSLSGGAFSTAYKDALDFGLSVYVTDGEWIYEVFPDGTRKQVKRIDPPTQAIPGQKIQLI